MARIKVAHVITRLDFGGAQQNTLATLRGLDAKRFDALLVCGEGGFFDQDVRCDPRVHAVFLDSLVREISPVRDVLALLELWKLFVTFRPEIVHTHSSKAGVLGRLAAAMAGVPIVVHTYHGFGFHDRQNPVVKRIYVTLERLCARWTTRLVYVSRANAEYAERHGLGSSQSALVIRSGVRLSDFPASVDAATLKMSVGIGRHKPLVLSIGNLKPQKNPADFVSAAAKVLERCPETRFVFIGDGPQRRALEAKAFGLGLEGKLLFLGWRTDAAQWLSACDVFAMTSLWEGLPRALVEALKTGRPAVCYATDGVVDILHNGENGFLVPPGNVDILAQRLVQLLSDTELRKRLGAAAAASIGPKFDVNAMIEAQQELYKRLLKRVGP